MKVKILRLGHSAHHTEAPEGSTVGDVLSLGGRPVGGLLAHAERAHRGRQHPRPRRGPSLRACPKLRAGSSSPSPASPPGYRGLPTTLL